MAELAYTLKGDEVWRVYDLVAAQVVMHDAAELTAMSDVGAAPWRRLHARLGVELGRDPGCRCPRGARYHAGNCPLLPDELMRTPAPMVAP